MEEHYSPQELQMFNAIIGKASAELSTGKPGAAMAAIVRRVFAAAEHGERDPDKLLAVARGELVIPSDPVAGSGSSMTE